jgi:hypothetical protein
MSDGFLSRWSRLKNEAKGEDNSPHPTPPPAEPEEGENAPPPADPIPELPPIETLTKDSDFSPFLQSGVPEELRRAALSRLWASDPLFTQPEVFDLHMEDYNAHPLGEVVRTAWKLGKGIVEDLADSASFPDDAENSQQKTKLEKNDTPAS